MQVLTLTSVTVTMEAVIKTVTTLLGATPALAMLDMRKVAFMDVMVHISLLSGQPLSHLAYALHGRY